MIFCLHVEFVFMLMSSQAAQAHYVWVRASEVIWSEYAFAKNFKDMTLSDFERFFVPGCELLVTNSQWVPLEIVTSLPCL